MSVIRDIYNPAEISLTNHAVIEASAGTGKTYTIQKLVVRLILEHGFDLSELLIVTFTEKATGELRERIFQALLDAKEEFPEGQKLLNIALGKFNEAKIFTIHSFCQRVLQEFAFENSNSFNFELTQDSPIYQKVLSQRKRLWQQNEKTCDLLREYYSESHTDPLLCKLAASSTCDDIIVPFDKNGIEFKQLQNHLLKELRSISRNDFSRYTEMTSLVKPKVKYEDLLLPVIQLASNNALSDKEVFEEIINLLPEKAVLGYLVKATSGKNKVNYEDELSSFPDLSQLSSIIDQLYGLHQKTKDSAWFSFLKSEIHHIKLSVKAYKQERSLLSFDDMINDVYESLQGDRGNFLKASLQKSLKVGLIDEFQDTDMQQWEIFKSIFYDCSDSQDTNRLMYIIGDPKQAIYRFRGADINAYLKARHELLEAGANYYNLPTNWRSLPALTSSFNQIFKGNHWFQTSSKNDWEITFRDSGHQDSQDLSFREKNGPAVFVDTSETQLVNFIELEDPEEKDDWLIKKQIADKYVEHIESVYKNVTFKSKGKIKSIGYSDICILIRKRQDFKTLEKAFIKAGIPYSLYKQSGIFQSTEAYALYYVLSSFQEPGNSGYCKRAFATDLFEISAQEALADGELTHNHPIIVLWSKLLILAERNQWAAFFRLLINDSGLLKRLHRTNKSHSAYIYEQLADELLALAIDQNLTIHSLAEKLLNYIESLEEATSDYHDKELEVDAVKVMTMHASKGLEFPVVFLFGGFTPLTERSSGYQKYFDPILQKSIIDLTETSKTAVMTEADAEIVRLYYVACTRAVLKLFIPVLQKKSILQKLFQEVSEQVQSITFTDKFSFVAENSASVKEVKYDFTQPKWQSYSSRRVGIYSFSSLAHYMDDSANISFSDKETQLARYDDTAKLQYIEAGEDELILPRGAATGDLLHEILENIDYCLFEKIFSPAEVWKPDTEIYSIIENALQKFPLPEQYLRDEQGRVIDSHKDALARMLFHTLKSPIPELGGKPLCSIGLKDTVREVEFNMPALGSESYLTGIIDLLMRVKKRDGSYVYYVLDWKTTSVVGDYFRSSLELSMREKKYKLQYEMYSHAVQDWFKNNFSNKHTLGGSIYIYLRGMNVNFPGRGVYFSRYKEVGNMEERITAMIEKSSGRK